MATATLVSGQQLGGAAGSGERQSGQAGFTLSELIIVVSILALLSTVAINSFLEAIERARLARCIVEVHYIQTAIWQASDAGSDLPTPAEFWSSHYFGKKPGPYYYLVDGDPNSGHGNDLDDVDEQNPGDSTDNREKKDIKFVVICQHDHKWLADFVYGEDHEPPQIALGGDAPNYERFVQWEFNPPGNDKDKKDKTK